jgi:tetratricopeptide (TPR) repeat protein
MPRRIVSILVALMMCAMAHASEESMALLKKAKEARAADQQEIALRQVTAAIKQDPNDLEARWFLIGLTLGEIGNYGLPARALPLADISPAINALAEMAKKAKQTAFLHYITASHASYYKNYERAIAEIDKALALEPKSVRFLAAKGRMMGRYGEWTGNDKRKESGILYLKHAAEQAGKEAEIDGAEDNYDFAIAMAISHLRRPRWQEVVQHYERYLQQTKYRSTSYAFAWNNVSIAYRKLGECQKAKHAAETALKEKGFPAAEMNRNRAEFCLEMRRLGMATNFTDEEEEPEFRH